MAFGRQAANMDRYRYVSMLALCACAAFALPRLLPPALLNSLDDSARMPVTGPAISESFPGSAYLLVEGTFDRAPVAAKLDSPHVFRLDDGPAAPSIRFRGLTPVDGYRASNCLTAAIYYEAGNEPEKGQRAVAQVVLNRVRHPAWPNTVCGVVYQGSERADLKCQFSFSCDGAMTRALNVTAWSRARRIALQSLAGRRFAPVGLATYYHTLAVKPEWSLKLKAVAVVGAHIFYRQPGAAGQPAAFGTRYAGFETLAGPSPMTLPFAEPVATPGPMPQTAETSATTTTINQASHPALPVSGIRAEYRSSGQPIDRK